MYIEKKRVDAAHCLVVVATIWCKLQSLLLHNGPADAVAPLLPTIVVAFHYYRLILFTVIVATLRIMPPLLHCLLTLLTEVSTTVACQYYCH